MKENILVLTAYLNLIARRLEQLIYADTDNKIEQKLKELNEKVYELSDVIETIEVMLE